MTHQPDGAMKSVVALSGISCMSSGQDMKLCLYLLAGWRVSLTLPAIYIGPSEAKMRTHIFTVMTKQESWSSVDLFLSFRMGAFPSNVILSTP